MAEAQPMKGRIENSIDTDADGIDVALTAPLYTAGHRKAVTWRSVLLCLLLSAHQCAMGCKHGDRALLGAPDDHLPAFQYRFHSASA